MTTATARVAVEKIRSITDDFEAAHGREDELLWDFIDHVASGDFGDLTDIAKIIQESRDIDFVRYCA